MDYNIAITITVIVYLLSFNYTSSDDKVTCLNNSTCISLLDNNVKDKELPKKPDQQTPKPDQHRDRYPLVPPFLIGAVVVMVVYCFFQCIYVHCYAKRTIQSKSSNKPPTIIIQSDSQDGDLQQITPMVRLDGGPGGRPEVVAAHPYLVCQPLDCDDDFSSGPSRRSSTKSRLSLQVPSFVRRLSRSSQGSPNDLAPSTAITPGERRRSRASICFLPVGQPIQSSGSPGDTASSNTEWTPLQGYIYSSFVLNRKPSYKHACADENQAKLLTPGEEEDQNKVFVFPSYSTFQRTLSMTSAAGMPRHDEETASQAAEEEGEAVAEVFNGTQQSVKVTFNLLEGEERV